MSLLTYLGSKQVYDVITIAFCENINLCKWFNILGILSGLGLKI